MAGSALNILIGIDDTDNQDSRGTGLLSRQLAHLFEVSKLATVHGITRHQLFVNSAIRYTSQNSSACLEVTSEHFDHLLSVCEAFLKEYSADGSDAGLCVAEPDQVNEEVMAWGSSAKHIILSMDEARALASRAGIYLRGFTGTHEGIIGALAAVGLRAGGNDGRFIWRRGRKELRDLPPGIMTAAELAGTLGLDAIASITGEQAAAGDRIRITEWVRPVLRNHQCLLIVEKTQNHKDYEWKCAPKETIRNIS